MINRFTNIIKYLLGIGICLGIRFLPFRAPNVEPVMGTLMPFAKRFGYLSGFLFGFVNIFLYDILTGKIGMWTWVTACSYGLLGLAAGLFFKNRKGSPANFFAFSVIGTIAYDAITGLTIGPVFYGQPFLNALTGQIPFTALHLLGNGVFALAISPLIDRFIVSNKSIELAVIREKFAT
ncbi:MAG: ECF transporter S component [Patescibacteria group bacterium]